MNRFPVLLLSLFFLLCYRLPAQSGCTDPQATNYDPNAMTNDGSCVYPVTNYTLTQMTALSTTLNETSGLVMANGFVWTHNDSGNQPRIYKIDSLTNTIIQTVTVGGATNIDWEDITFDGTYFYVGDFGNNANGNRTDLKIYKFPYAAIPSGSNVTVPSGQVQVIHYSYEDQSDFTAQGSNNTIFDCESIIYHEGQLHLFTKDWINHYTTHYTLPADAGTYQAVNQETFFANGLITAADISGPGVIILQGYEFSGGPVFFWLLFDYQSGVYFSGNKRRIQLGSWVINGQTEGICFRNGSYGYVSNERFTAAIPARLYSFNISQWLEPIFLPVELSRFSVRPTAAGALLEWETATEQDNAGFAVERSADAYTFSPIGFVPGQGDSREPRQYQFIDPEPGNDRYYRLRQRDYDGSENQSAVVALPAGPPSNCLISPNPISQGQNLQSDQFLSDEAQVSLWDVWGNLCWQGKASGLSAQLLPPGVYGLQVWADDRGQLCVTKLVVE